MPILVGTVETGDGEAGDVLQRRYATIGDLLFGGIDPFGTRVYLVDIKGWHSSGTTGSVQQRAADDGGWLTPAYLTPRPVELVLRLRGRDFPSIGSSLDRIINSVPVKALADLNVFDHAQQLVAAVRQNGDILVDRKAAAATVSIPLIAPDHRRYSPVLEVASTGLPTSSGGLSLPVRLPVSLGATSTTGRVLILNSGNESTPPIFTVHGPCPPCTITQLGTGRQLQVPDAIPAGHFLTIDVDKHTALLDGTASRVVTGTWFMLPPGESQVAFTGGPYDPGANLQVAWRSASR